MPRVAFTSNLQWYVECPTCEVHGATVRDALAAIFSQYPRLRGYVIDEQGQLRTHMAVFIDGHRLADRNGLTDTDRHGQASERDLRDAGDVGEISVHTYISGRDRAVGLTTNVAGRTHSVIFKKSVQRPESLMCTSQASRELVTPEVDVVGFRPRHVTKMSPTS